MDGFQNRLRNMGLIDFIADDDMQMSELEQMLNIVECENYSTPQDTTIDSTVYPQTNEEPIVNDSMMHNQIEAQNVTLLQTMSISSDDSSHQRPAMNPTVCPQSNESVGPSAYDPMMIQTHATYISHDQTEQAQHLTLLQMGVSVSQMDQGRGRKTNKKMSKAPKKYQLTLPFKDKTLELQRINAIKAKDYREKKKRMELLLKEENNRFKQELMKSDQKLRTSELDKAQLVEENNRLRQENYQLRMKLKHAKN